MKALVLGANGHIGAHLCRELLANGEQVRAFVRPGSATESLADLPLELVRGDVLDRASLRSALAGCDRVYHLAAPTGVGDKARDTIVAGSTNVIQEAAAAGVRKVVYTSSVVAIGYVTDPRQVLDERSSQRSSATEYHAAKWDAEQLVLQTANECKLPLVIVNPATVIGSLDYRTTPSTAPIVKCLTSGLPVWFRAGVTIAPVQDVARGQRLAMERGRAGERYILGGERLQIRDWFATISSACGRPAPKWRLPRAAMLGVGACFSLLHACGVRGVPFTFKNAWNLEGHFGFYSSAKAESELGYRPRSAQEAVADYVQWARTRRAA